MRLSGGFVLTRCVIAGLDPAIHQPSDDASCEGGWIRGSSPRMTLNLRFAATFIRKRLYFVFHALQNAWPDAVADQFFDRRGSPRRDSLGHAMGFPWPQARGGFRRIARNMRIFAARKAVALSAGVPISPMGCRAG